MSHKINVYSLFSYCTTEVHSKEAKEKETAYRQVEINVI